MKKIIFTILNFVITLSLFGQTWPCGQFVSRQILVSGTGTTATYKTDISALFINNGAISLTSICENTTDLVNATALYNGYIFGWKQFAGTTTASGSTTTLLKLNNDCSRTAYNITFPTASTATYNNAFVDDMGNYYMLTPVDATSSSALSLVKINLNTLSETGTNNAVVTTINPAVAGQGYASFPNGIGDMYIVGNVIYFWANNQGLGSLDLATNTYTRIPNTTNVVETIGSLFVNSADPGFLYGYGSSVTSTESKQTTIVKIPLTGPNAGSVIDVVTGGVTVLQSDGAGCSEATFQVPPPIAESDVLGTNGTIDPTLNDAAFGGNTLDKTTVSFVPPTTATNIIRDAQGDVISMDIPGQGTWSVNPTTGIVTFVRIPGFTAAPQPILYTIKDNLGQISNQATITGSAITLPIKLSKWEAKYLNNQVKFNWATSEEKNFGYFELQESNNVSSFENIAKVTSNESKKYSYVHPVNGNVIKYYRLKMVDLDGTIDFSQILAININNLVSSAYLVDNTLFVESNSKSLELLVSDLTGRNITGFKKISNTGGLSQFAIPAGLTKGMYIVKMKTENGTVSRRVFIN